MNESENGSDRDDDEEGSENESERAHDDQGIWIENVLYHGGSPTRDASDRAKVNDGEVEACAHHLRGWGEYYNYWSCS